MPNWVSNTMTVSGCTDEQIKRIVDAVQREELLNEFYPQPDWRQTPNEDGVLPGPLYKGEFCHHFPDGTADQRWYGWCNSHWGVKWDISDPYIDVADGVVTVCFNSPWSPPSDGWFAQMSESMPDAVIRCTFSEPGCDFYGLTVATEGEASTEDACLSELKDEWAKRTLTPEKLAIYQDEDHKEHDDLIDEINEQWWDVEADEIDRAFAAM